MLCRAFKNALKTACRARSHIVGGIAFPVCLVTCGRVQHEGSAVHTFVSAIHISVVFVVWDLLEFPDRSANSKCRLLNAVLVWSPFNLVTTVFCMKFKCHAWLTCFFRGATSRIMITIVLMLITGNEISAVSCFS